MNKFKIILFFIVVTASYGQTNNEKLTMIDFSPKTKAYNIYYPKKYSVNESDDNIVTLTNTETGLNLTISNYTVPNKLKEENLIELLGGFVTDIKKTDWKSYKSKFDNLIEGRIENDNENWIWWGISSNKNVVIISANKDNPISDEETKLMRFMINKLEIH